MTNRERFYGAIKGEKLDRIPVFPLLMSFSAARFGINYKEYASNGKALAGAQLLVQDKFDLDCITNCSDAFRIAGALGGELIFPESKPPHLAKPIVKNASDIDKLGHPDPSDTKNRMGDRVVSAKEMVKASKGKFAVGGWIDMPFAEACSLCGVSEFMLMLYDEPAIAHKLLDFLTDLCIGFALAQVGTGVDIIGAGDAAASLLSPEKYREFALPYETRIVDAIHNKGTLVKLHICGNTMNIIEDMVKCGADLYNVDHMIPFEKARDIYLSHNKCFKGNLDPVRDILFSNPDKCRDKAKKCISLSAGSKYILSAGCEIPAETSDEVFRAFCEAAKN